MNLFTAGRSKETNVCPKAKFRPPCRSLAERTERRNLGPWALSRAFSHAQSRAARSITCYITPSRSFPAGPETNYLASIPAGVNPKRIARPDDQTECNPRQCLCWPRQQHIGHSSRPTPPSSSSPHALVLSTWILSLHAVDIDLNERLDPVLLVPRRASSHPS